MEVLVESLSPVEKKMTIRIPAERVTKEIDAAYRTLQRDVVMPGFRKGKVPRRFLENRFGHHVQGEVGSKLITESYEKAIEENGVVPVSQPLIEKGEVRTGADYEFSVRIEVRPELKVEDYTGLDVAFDDASVSDEEVDGELQKLRNQAGQMNAVTEERPVREGDLVVADFALSAEGQPEFTQSGYLLSPSDPQHGVLHAPLIGHGVGSEVATTVTLPAGYYQRRFAGQEVAVRAKVLGIKELAYPEVDDALAKELGHDSLDALKADIRFRLEQAKERRARERAGNRLVQTLVERHPMEVPPGLLRGQAEQMIRNTTSHLQSKGMKVRNLHLDDLDPENRQKVLDEASLAIKRTLVLESVADQEKIEVTEEDLDEKIQEIAAENGQRVEAVRGILVKNNAIEDLKARIREDKALDFLLERANIVELEPGASVAGDAPAERVSESEAPAGEGEGASQG
ncbi:trigger factor [Myxococcota bacterium]|nr:trigger factor [Myxococcota bacterium]